jgi:Tfp pilus assembly protein PilO
MKSSDKGILLGVLVAVVLLGFYVKVLSPKRSEASKLSDDITSLQSSIDQQKQVAAFGEDARQHFPTYYGRLVVLGKAIPDQADTASLLVELNSVSSKSGVKFKALDLTEGGESAADATAASSSSSSGTSTTPETSTTSTTPSAPDASSSSTATPASSTTPAPATEASAANVPIGSSVGPGGLTTLPYALTFEGSFFDVTNFFSGLDSLNHVRGGGTMVAADGRLMTVDGFSLSLVDQISGSNPPLDVSLAVTTYVAPADQGLTAGASPGGPAPSVSQPETQTTSATVSP